MQDNFVNDECLLVRGFSSPLADKGYRFRFRGVITTRAENLFVQLAVGTVLIACRKEGFSSLGWWKTHLPFVKIQGRGPCLDCMLYVMCDSSS